MQPNILASPPAIQVGNLPDRVIGDEEEVRPEERVDETVKAVDASGAAGHVSCGRLAAEAGLTASSQVIKKPKKKTTQQSLRSRASSPTSTTKACMCSGKTTQTRSTNVKNSCPLPKRRLRAKTFRPSVCQPANGQVALPRTP